MCFYLVFPSAAGPEPTGDKLFGELRLLIFKSINNDFFTISPKVESSFYENGQSLIYVKNF